MIDVRRIAITLTACTLGALCVGCILLPDYESFSFYAPIHDASAPAACDRCDTFEISESQMSISLRHQASGNTLTITTYDALSLPGYLKSDHGSQNTLRVTLWINVECRGDAAWRFIPRKVGLKNLKDGAHISILNLAEFVPSTANPVPVAVSREGVLIDPEKPVECDHHRSRSISGYFDFDKNQTDIQLALNDSLVSDGAVVKVPDIHFELKRGSRYRGLRPVMLLPMVGG